MRLSVELDDVARAGWEAMGRRTGGSLTAIANVLGRVMLEQVEAGLEDASWQAIAEQISAEAWNRRRRD